MPSKTLPNSQLLKMNKKQLDTYWEGQGGRPKLLVNKKPVNKRPAGGGKPMPKGTGDSRPPRIVAASRPPVARGNSRGRTPAGGGGGPSRPARRARAI